MLQKGQSCDHSAWLCWLSPKICLGGRNQDQELAGFWQGSGGAGRSQPIGQSVCGGLTHLWLFLTYLYLQEYSRSFQPGLATSIVRVPNLPPRYLPCFSVCTSPCLLVAAPGLYSASICEWQASAKPLSHPG